MNVTTIQKPFSSLNRQLTRNPLDAIFAPKSVAVVGATEKPGSVGRTVLWNLMNTPFGGPIYPVNPTRTSVLGIKAYPKLAGLPEKPELVVVTTPAASIPGIIGEAADLGIPGAVVISAGFKETGPAGVELERQLLAHARRGNMRLVGPNCLGVMNPITGVNATFAAGIARRGNVAFISQSGALCTAVLDWSLREEVGFSAFVSIGSMLDVGWGDLISYFGDDPNTKSIVIYMESIGDARSFLSAAREVALTKSIIIIKPGRTEGAAKAAASHTGSLTGSDDVLEAAFKRCGVLRVNKISDLFYMSEVLAKQPRPQGNRLTIITNAGGPGVLATDALLTTGGALAEVSKETMEDLNKFLPAVWSHNNPIDIIGDAGPDLYAKTLETAGRDPNSDGLLVILTPQAMTDATATAEKLKAFGHISGKPVLASWMGGNEVAAGEAILNRAGVPTFAYPDTAAMVFTSMYQYNENLRALYETPVPSADPADIESGRAKANTLIQSIRKSGRTILTEAESKDLMGCYGIPTVVTKIAKTEAAAVKAAAQIGYPIVLKLYSETITHKTDVGGVQLNLKDEADVRRAFNEIKTSVTEKKGAEHFQGVTVQKMIKLSEGYELILGSSIDPQFGPVLLFGMGGQLVEVFKDKALGLPPLNTTLARRMMESTRIYKALKGVRGRRPVDLAALERLMVGFSQLVAEQHWIKEIDINPLFASGEDLVALDARVILHDPKTAEEQLPKLAIRPYPTQYVASWKIKGGAAVTIRPIRPEDEPAMVSFHEGLSERSVYLRYFSALNLEQRVAHSRLLRICFNDYDREIALVAERNLGKGKYEILGVGRMSKLHGSSTAEFAVVVTDKWQHKGLGTELGKRLIEIARHEKLSRLVAYTLAENHDMQNMCKRLGFQVVPSAEDSEVVIEMNL
ncbi:MAG TPA: bifunctional acetate--CoA ligase family protein/GNAT family N-acetyltransferase [Candidatus Acidoferrum sp.]|jgi:acetyltransferase|nr:bifunctional acetate--CoA ligase family protein/GNAT family N-acetyltransferase [Candidatus Acidoferrum sp.]